jgi:hypothetical protein
MYSLDPELESLCIDMLSYEKPIDVYMQLKFLIRCEIDIPNQIYCEITDCLATSSLNLYSLWTEEYTSVVNLHLRDLYLERETAELEFDCAILSCWDSQCMDRNRKTRQRCLES